MTNLRMKWILRRDEIQRFHRICRVCWERGRPGFPGGGYSAKLSVAWDWRLFRLPKSDAGSDWRFTIFGIRLHYCRSYGGVFP